MTQKEAVYKATVEAFEHHTNAKWVDGVKALEALTSDYLRKVKDMTYDTLKDWFQHDEITCSSDFTNRIKDEEYLRKYIVGLTSNWWRKDRRYTGQDYIPARDRDPNGRPDATLPTRVEEPAQPKACIVKACDCGAAHTSNPNHHSSWCSSQ